MAAHLLDARPERVLAAARDDALWTRIKQVRSHHGAILGPFEAWLLLRGMRTLEARCSIRLSTPPSEVARFHNCTRAAASIAARSPPFTRIDSMPPKPDIWRAATACPGCEGSPG